MEAVVPPPPRGRDETGGTEMHPLENRVVLERLFELIPFELKVFQSIRLVCRAWHENSLPTWRKNACIVLRDSDEDDRDTSENLEDEEVEQVSGISRQKYLDLIENEQLHLIQHPFRNYSLNKWKIELQSVNQDGEQDQIRFWNRVGPLMTHLKLSHSNFSGVADFRTVIFEATSNLQSSELINNIYNDKRPAKKEQRLDPKLPQHAEIPAEKVQNNLVVLEIQLAINRYRGGFQEIKFLPITWMELFIHFPNIKKFGPVEFGADAEDELLELFESVEILRKERGPGYLADLSDLELLPLGFNLSTFCEPLISSITRLQFTLKRLDFVIDQTVDEETFKKLLQHPLLEHLNVVREHGSEPRPFQNFPFGLKFMALKGLRMWGCIAPNLVFLKECPNLEKFLFDDPEADLSQGLIEGNPTKLEKLTDLTFLLPNFLGTEEIRKLGEFIPNVRKLHVTLEDGSFRAVCEIWKELEHLTVTSWRIGEEDFLGKDEQSGENYQHPNITDLKSLKQFKITGFEREFTDAMIEDGIQALPNLEHLDL